METDKGCIKKSVGLMESDSSAASNTNDSEDGVVLSYDSELSITTINLSSILSNENELIADSQ